MSAVTRPAGAAATERTIHRLITPEGVPLDLEVALAGDRLAAFLIDALIILGACLLVFFLTSLTGKAEFMSLGLIAFFLLRNFYFMFFEHRWQGTTLGKRSRRLRVIDAQGGQLTVEAIIVRNLTRDIEIFLPLIMLLAPQALWPEAPFWARPLAGLWGLVLGLMPLFNRQRRRVGDLVAGTMVIATPQVALLGDLAATATASATASATNTGPSPDDEAGAGAARPVRGHVFSRAQLSVYGIYELQVLEKVLRAPSSDEMDRQLAAIRDKICAKIGYSEPVPHDYEFLKDFYAAQRAHLESRLMLGERREDKFAGTDPAAQEDGSKPGRNKPGQA